MFLGYCQLCDNYRSFEKYDDELHCSYCGFSVPYNENSSNMVQEVEIKVEGVVVRLQPPLLRASSAFHSDNPVDFLDAMPQGTAGWSKIFEGELRLMKEDAKRRNVALGCIVVLDSADGKITVSTALQVEPDGSIVPYRHKSSLVIAPAPPPVKYYEYLKSSEWQIKRQEALKRAGNRCQICNSSERLNAHHRTYKNLGHEVEGDITILCRDCHQLFSDNGRLARD